MERYKAAIILPIIEAFSKGELIELKYHDSDLWEETSTLDVDSDICIYRIKPKPKLAPFTFEDRELFKDKWIKLKGKAWLKRIITIMTNNIVIFAVDKYEELDFIHISYEKLLSDYEFDDKSPCGKYINE